MKIREDQYIKILELLKKVQRHYNHDSTTELFYSEVIVVFNNEIDRLNDIKSKNHEILNTPINQLSKKYHLGGRTVNILKDLKVNNMGKFDLNTQM